MTVTIIKPINCQIKAELLHIMIKHRNISFRLLLQASLLVIPFLLIVAMLFNGSEGVISWKGVLLASSTTVVLAFLLWRTESSAAFSTVAALSVYLLVLAYPRLIQLAAIPSSTSLVQLFNMNQGQYDKALTYLALGTVAISLGAFLGGRVRIKAEATRPEFELKTLIFAFLLVSSSAIYWQLGRGATVLLSTASSIAADPLSATASQLFSHHVAMIFLLSNIVIYKKPNWIIFIAAIAYVIVTVILGSRWAGISILFMMTSLLAWRGSICQFNVKMSSAFGFLIMLVVVSALVFPLGTAIRENYLNQRIEKKDGAVGIKDTRARERAAGIGGREPTFNVNPNLLVALNRGGANQDSQILILSIPARQDLAEKYLNVNYALKSAVNILVPGIVFDDAKITTAFLPRFIYEGADPKLLTKDYYETRPFTAWGFSFSHFGWSGGLIFLLFASAASTYLYSLLLIWCQGPSLPAIYLYSMIFGFFGMSGLDAFIVDGAKSLVHTFVFIFIVKFIGCAIFIFRKRKGAT